MNNPTASRPQVASTNHAPCWLGPGTLDLVQITGDDAGSFLQAQLTCDVELLTAEIALPFAWCAANGRVRYSGWLARHKEDYLLLLASNRARDCAAALRPYVLRARVVLQAGKDAGLTLSWQPAASAATGIGCDRDGQDQAQFLLPGQPVRRVHISSSVAAAADERNGFVLAGIRAGVCELPAALENRYLPQMLNLDLIGGVSFTKGCYPGQEVIARTHHLGRVKRRLMRFRAEHGIWPVGTDVLNGGKVAGQIVASASVDGACELLAVVNLELAPGGALALDVPTGPALFQEPLPYALP